MSKTSFISFGATSVLFLLSLLFALDAKSQTNTPAPPRPPRFVAPRFAAPKTETPPPPASLNSASADANALDVPKDASTPLLLPSADSDAADSNATAPDNATSATSATDLEGATVLEIAPAISSDETRAAPASIPHPSVATSAPTANSNVVKRAPYDPIKENGEYFVGWSKPKIAIVFTGMTNGYIEPCGCAGMDRMKGGLSRRKTFLGTLRDELGWDVVAVDAGQITDGFGVQEELKFDMATNAFRTMEYDAIALGRGELRFPAYFLLTFTAPTSATSPSLFTSANVGVYGFHPTYTLPYKIVERSGLKIGVVSVVYPSSDVDHRDENIFIEAPEKKLAELAPTLKQAGCDKWILVVHGTEAETIALAKKFPTFDFVVSSDSPSEPPAELKTLEASQSLIEVGEKGKFAVVLGLYDDGEIRYQRVALDSRFESSEEIALLMKDYQSILKTLVTTKGYREGLGITPVRSPNADLLGKYVGAKKCESCHEESYRVWLRSRHATAWKSLKETANPPRDFDPECVGCHVDGWEGIQRFPYLDGFATEETTPELLNVGCESCHGPGEKHVAAELADDETAQENIREAMRLGNNVKKVCYSCHDGDNSPEFDYDKYYPLIEHIEAGADEEE